jgi:ankyrin repeat protein
LEQGADVEAKDLMGGSTALSWACWKGHLAVARILLEHGAEVDPTNKWGWTPLLMASREGHREIVRLLLDNDADPCIKNNDGRTAVDLCTKNYDGPFVAKQIKKRGWQNNVVDMLEVKQKRGWRGRGGRRSRKRAFGAHLVVGLPFPRVNHSNDPSTPSVLYHTLTLSALRSPPSSARC